MKILAVTNIKGGVGKTTTAVNLAYLCAGSGKATILWDLDPQGAATYTLRCEPADNASAKQLVNEKRALTEVVLATAYPHFDVIPADFSYRNFDVHLSERKHRTGRLLKMSRALRERYEVLVLDCPPGISLLSENVLRAADAVIVPLIPTPLSVRMLEQLRDFTAAKAWTDMQLLPFFSMVDRRKSLHRQVVEDLRPRFPELLATEVPYWSDIEKMALRRAPLPSYAPHGPAAQVYGALWAEIERRLAVPFPVAAALPAPQPLSGASAAEDEPRC